jgi:tRNA pseudouridine38-40 synthase
MAFDGSNYSGWQIQPKDSSIQQVLEHSLSTLLKQEIAVTGAGRTDSGVHASHFVAHFDLENSQKSGPEHTQGSLQPASEKFLFRLNRFLPRDIVVYKIFRVRDDLHARFSATRRTYHYHISSVKPLFDREYCLHVYGKLDLNAIGECCEVIRETRDFTSFARLHSDVKTNICTVSHARWKVLEKGYRFEISADRFLRNMVRSLTGTLLDVGLGKIDPDGFREIVNAKDRGLAGSSAPAKGLFLVDISYPPSDGA